MFDFKVKGDYHGYLVELATGDAESKAVENARVAYAEDTETAGKYLVVTYPIRLDLMLNFSVYQHEVIQNPDEAFEMRMSAVVQFGPGAVDDPHVNTKSLITHLMNRVQSENGVMKFGASADKNQFALVKALITDLSHGCKRRIYRKPATSVSVMRKCKSAPCGAHSKRKHDSRTAAASNNQQSRQHKTERKRQKKEDRERKVRKKGRRKERMKEKWCNRGRRKKLGRMP